MTTEDDFQNALDAQPDDWQTRLVFADWLQERGDPRAEGYRALGVNRCFPLYTSAEQYRWIPGHMRGTVGDCWLPWDWTEQIPDSNHRDSRREAEDAAALAFAQLPPERRAELLAAPALLTPRTE